MKKKPDLRTKIISIISGTFIVYHLPATVLLDSVRFDLDQDGGLVLKDEGGYSMDVGESVYTHDSQK